MYQGFFINLASSDTRRRALSEHLEEIAASNRYARFEAIDGRAVASQYTTSLKPGQLGCWLSHHGVLAADRAASTHVHVIEDDTILPKDAVSCFDSLLQEATERAPDWDVILTDVRFPLDPSFVRQLGVFHSAAARQGGWSLMPLEGVAWSCLNSYFVRDQSIVKLAKVMAGGWRSKMPVDLYMRALTNKGAIKTYLTVPFLSSITRDGDLSDIKGATVTPFRSVVRVLRRAFFKEADTHALLAELDLMIGEERLAPPLHVYLRALQYFMAAPKNAKADTPP